MSTQPKQLPPPTLADTSHMLMALRWRCRLPGRAFLDSPPATLNLSHPLSTTTTRPPASPPPSLEEAILLREALAAPTSVPAASGPTNTHPYANLSISAMQSASRGWDPSSTYDHPLGGDPWGTRPQHAYVHPAIELTASPSAGGRGWVAKAPGIRAGELCCTRRQSRRWRRRQR